MLSVGGSGRWRFFCSVMFPMPSLLLLCSLLLAACTVAPDAGPPAGPPPAAPAPDYEATFTRVLQAVVTEGGLVRYDRLATDFQADFDSVRVAIEQRDPATLTSDAEKLAFFLNAYNVWMLDNILGAPEVTNIEQDGRFEDFFQTPFRIAGLNMTLNQLENGILRLQDTVDGQPLPEGLRALRPTALDPRIHVGLNCAAVSCPRLRREAFTPETVDAQLAEARRQFADETRFADVDGAEIVFSSLLDWFGEDFEVGGEALGDYWLAVMSPSRPGYTSLQPLLEGRSADALRAVVAGEPTLQYGYDWTVNRAN